MELKDMAELRLLKARCVVGGKNTKAECINSVILAYRVQVIDPLVAEYPPVAKELQPFVEHPLQMESPQSSLGSGEECQAFFRARWPILPVNKIQAFIWRIFVLEGDQISSVAAFYVMGMSAEAKVVLHKTLEVLVAYVVQDSLAAAELIEKKNKNDQKFAHRRILRPFCSLPPYGPSLAT